MITALVLIATLSGPSNDVLGNSFSLLHCGNCSRSSRTASPLLVVIELAFRRHLCLVQNGYHVRLWLCRLPFVQDVGWPSLDLFLDVVVSRKKNAFVKY